ncbi:MAG: class I SAM-dependent methyltransferase [bacterium]|nr:class I SAM-dependent methyltransferase [bacterium]
MKEGTRFLEALQENAKMFAPAVMQNVAIHEEDCAWLLDPLARWTQDAYGDEAFELAAKGYARYCIDVTTRQRKYEKSGVFTEAELAEVTEEVYQDPEYMIPYMWAAVLIYPYWPSMVRHLSFFRDRFLGSLGEDPRVLELACGHGVMGLLAAEERDDAHVTGFDISPAAIGIAERLRGVSKHGDRVELAVKDVLDLNQAGEPGTYKGVIAAMVAEHLQEPKSLLETVKHHLAEDGVAFFSTALESAQKDHIYEFNTESQVLRFAEDCGLRAAEMISDGDRRPGERFRPRAMAVLLEHN